MLKRNLLLTCLCLIAPYSIEAQDTGTPDAPPVLDEQTTVAPAEVDATAAVSEMLGISTSEVDERLTLQDAAADWASELARNAPAGFVSLDIEHTPRFVVNVYFTRDVPAQEVARIAPPALRRYIRASRVKRSLEEMELAKSTIVDALGDSGIEYALYSDLRTDKIVVALFDQAQKNEALDLLPADLRSDIRFEQGKRSRDVGGIYSGNWYRKGGASGTICTMSFPIRNSRGQEALITAAHCEPRNPYFPYVDSGVFLGAPYAAREETYYGRTYDYAIYTLGANYTAPYTYIDNGVTYNGYTNTVPGFTDGYYSISDVIPTSSQVRGYLMCKNGARSGFSCGEILSTSYDEPERNVYDLVQVGNSSQPNIAVPGDSGGPIFTYPNGASVRAAGVMKSVAASSDGVSACQNSRSCFFLYMPLSYATTKEPFTVNTASGFKVP